MQSMGMIKHLSVPQLSRKAKALRGGFLIVCDSSERDTLERALLEGGLFAGTCSNGKQALNMLRTMAFGGVLCDLSKHRTEAMKLLKEVRTNFPEVAFVMITSPKGVREGILASIAGASGYVVKPLDRDAILASVNRALDRKHLDLRLETFFTKREVIW